MKLLVIALMLLTTSCGTLFSGDDVKNYGGSSIVTVEKTGEIIIETKQPDNPSTAAQQTVEIRPDKTMVITQQTGGAYENKLGKLKGIFGMAKFYHMSAIFCIIAGIIIRGLPVHFSNKVGWSIIIAGVALFVAGSMLPDMGRYIAIAGVVGGIVGLWYVYHKSLLHKEPPK